MDATRRNLLKGGLVLGAGAVAAPVLAQSQDWTPSLRYPDPRVKSLDKRFDQYRIIVNANVERLHTGMRWAEGPVWIGDQRLLIWSDIPNNQMLKFDEVTGQTSVFRASANNSNGNTRDREGRLITCEHLTRRVTRTEYDGSITVLADRYQGKRFNSPNDAVVKSDGSIWFTDPAFGINGWYEGDKATPELPTSVYRIDGKNGGVTMVATDIAGPNGLSFSPDESKLYVVDAASTPNVILAFDVAGDRLTRRRVFADADEGTPDGIRCDVDGNLWVGWGMGRDDLDGVRVFTPEGLAMGHISLPERCANLAFGGVKRNRLYMVASHSLYALYVNTRGAGYG